MDCFEVILRSEHSSFSLRLLIPFSSRESGYRSSSFARASEAGSLDSICNDHLWPWPRSLCLWSHHCLYSGYCLLFHTCSRGCDTSHVNLAALRFRNVRQVKATHLDYQGTGIITTLVIYRNTLLYQESYISELSYIASMDMQESEPLIMCESTAKTQHTTATIAKLIPGLIFATAPS